MATKKSTSAAKKRTTKSTATRKKRTTTKPKEAETKVVTIPQGSGGPLQQQMLKQNESMLEVVARAAANPKVNVDKMKALLDMQREIRDDMAQQAFFICMNECQGELPTVVRKAENTHTKSKYAKLEAIDRAVRPVYTKHGFSLSFDSEPSQDPNRVIITCLVAHAEGHSKLYRLAGDLDVAGAKGTANKNKMQGLGSSTSYLQRYLTCMIFNIVPKDHDDDAGGCGDPVNSQPKNEFAERVKQESTGGNVIDGDYQEVPDEAPWNGSVIIDGREQKIQASEASGAGKYLISVLKKRNHKKSRQDLVNENIALLHALKKAGNDGMIDQIHSIADKGE
jgi:hypothetical protein